MNTIQSINIENGQIRKKIITISWTIIDLCNYGCWYCIAENIKKYKTRVEDDELTLFINSIKRIHKQKPECLIEIIISGGEPSINPLLGKILQELLSMDIISGVSITTNGSHIKKHVLTLSDALKLKLEIRFSFHQSEEKNTEDFINNVLLLQKKNFDVKVLFLHDYNINIKKIRQQINILSAGLGNMIIEHEKLIVDHLTSSKYSQTQEELYNSCISNQIYIHEAEMDIKIQSIPSKELIKLTGKDGVKLKNVLDKNENKKFKGYLCDPSYFHIVRPDGLVLYGGCDLFGFTEKNLNFYDPKFNLLEKMIHCTKEDCFCSTSIANPKIRDEKKILYYTTIDKLLLKICTLYNKDLNHMNIEKIRLIDNNFTSRRIKIKTYLKENGKNLFIIQELDTPFRKKNGIEVMFPMQEKFELSINQKNDLYTILQRIPKIIYAINASS